MSGLAVALAMALAQGVGTPDAGFPVPAAQSIGVAERAELQRVRAELDAVRQRSAELQHKLEVAQRGSFRAPPAASWRRTPPTCPRACPSRPRSAGLR